jgi:hypothetical protein
MWAPAPAILVITAAAIWLVRRRWPITTILLYVLWVATVFTPLVLFTVFWVEGPGNLDLGSIREFVVGLYSEVWPFWIFCGILIVSQILLLIVPVRIVRQRPKPQRGIWVTAIAAGALFAIVVLGILWSVAVALFGDYAIEDWPSLAALVFLGVNWIVWSCVFRAFARNTDPRSYIRRLMKWLLRGTVLELLIAVPSHIIVRHKDVCCAHGITAAGIATGLAIMLVSFGPGIYFLYAEKMESKKPQARDSGRV